MLFSTFKAGRWLAVLGVLLLGALPGRAQRLATGWRHTLSIHADGTLWAWGYNYYGQLGTGTSGNPQNMPVQVGTATTWTSVSAGANFSVGLRTDGTLWAWGRNDYGQLGQGTSSLTAVQLTPVQVGTATTWTSVSAGGNHVVALRSDRTLWTWGQSSSGQLGLGAATTQPQTTPAQVGTVTTWRSISAGYQHTLALRQDGTLWSWGNNGNGQLGLGTSGTTAQATPAQVGTATTWQTVSGGGFHTLALQQNGTLWAWGNGTATGLGSYANQLTPAQVGTATTWRSISGGWQHSAAVQTNNSLWTWGENRLAALGLGASSTLPQATPAQAGTGASWQTVVAGQYYTVALQTDGSFWAWGFHSYGQLGSGPGPQLVPYALPSPDTWRTVSAGSYHNLGLRPDGTLWGWGLNGNGQLGPGTNTDQRLPAQVGTSTWQAVSAGYQHSVAVRSDGTLWAWGDNSQNALGDGTTTNQNVPVQIGTATNWRGVSTGYHCTFAIKTDGTLWAWGRNTQGQLGLGTTTQQATPAQVGTSTWLSVAANQFASITAATLAIRSDNTLWAWGNNNNYQLGLNNPGLQQTTPLQVGTATWRSVAVGMSHALGVQANGTLWGWGSNSSGQVGTGTSPTTQTTPTQVGTATDWTSAAANYNSSFALRGAGTLYTWGNNAEGQLGDGTYLDHSTPTALPGSTTWQGISAGLFHTAAVQANASGTLWLWGYNAYNQLTLVNNTPLPAFVPNGGAPLATTVPAATAGWTLTPNPAHDQVQVLGLPAGPVAVQLYDATGRLVRQAAATTVPTAGLAPGLYLLRATAGGATRTLRLAVE